MFSIFSDYLLKTMARIGATFGFAFTLGLLFVSFEIVSSGKIHFFKKIFDECRNYVLSRRNYVLTLIS